MKRKPRGNELDAHARRQLTVAAMVDPKTLTRFLRGERVRELSARRIRAAMVKLGFSDHVHEEDRAIA